MEHEARLTQDRIQVAHDNREHEVHEPLYGLAPEPGQGGPQSVGDPNQPGIEMPVEEPADADDTRINMTWGLIFGGLLLLFILTAALYMAIGNTYSSAPFTQYPLK
jgi:hypothetical protein